MSAPLYPPGGTNLVNLQNSGSLNLGDNLSLKFDGSSPFTIEGWVQPHNLDDAPLFAKKDEFTLAIQGQKLYAKTATQQFACVGSTALSANQWNYVAVTFDGTTMCLYLDGCLDVSLATGSCGVQPTSHPFLIGSDGSTTFNGDIMRFILTSAARAPQKMYRAPFKAFTPKSNTIAEYDCSQSPPKDMSGNNNPITLEGTAVSQHSQLALLVEADADGAAVPQANSNLIPGASAPYTVEGWFYFNEAPENQGRTALFANVAADLRAHQYGLLALIAPTGFASGDPSYVDAYRQTQSIQCGPLAVNTWYHLAMTYDGATLTLYVNGASASSAAMGPLTAGGVANPRVGGMAYTGADPLSMFGYIQYLSYWNVSLTAAEIAALQEAPAAAEGLVANYSFIGAPAIDTMQGQAVALSGSAALSDQRGAPVPGAVATVQMRGTMPKQRSLSSCQPLHGKAPTQRIEPLSPQHVQLMRDALARALPADVSPELRAQYEAQLETNVAEAIRRAKEEPQFFPRHVTELIDGRYRMTLQLDSGPVAVDLGTEQLTACQEWWIVFTTTVIMGLFAAVGLIGVPNKVADFVVAILVDASIAALLTTAISAANGQITQAMVINFMEVLWNSGYLKTMLWVAVEAAGWWTLVTVLVFIIKCFVPGLWLASFLANAAVLGTQLLMLYNGDGTEDDPGYATACGASEALAT